MLKAMYDNGIDILTKEDAALYDLLAGSLDFVISGIGNQLEVTSSGLTITLKTGQCLIKGRHVVETIGNTTLLLPANSSGYIVISYDITKANGFEAELMYVSSLISEDLNNNGQRRDFPLYSFVSTAAVITLTDLRVMSSTVSLLAKIVSLDNLKAPKVSPTFTGVPAAPTADVSTNTTQLATTAFVKAVIAALLDSTPSTLDTLNELAAALGDDPNFATTMTTALGLKAPKAAPALTGAATLDGRRIISNNLSAGTPVYQNWSGTQAQYDAIGAKDANTIYFIV